MPEFSTPKKIKNIDKKFSHEEIIRAIRFSIASEFEAIQIYEQIKESVDNAHVQTVLDEIIGDEKEHVGNFLHLMKLLAPTEIEHYDEGEKEAKKLLE